MGQSSEHGQAAAIDGHWLQLDEQHGVAMYRREGTCWVAEFRGGGAAALVDASSWFRFHMGDLRNSHGHRAAALLSATALTPQMIQTIERLHRQADLNDARTKAMAVAALAAVQRYWAEITAVLGAVRSKRA